MAGRASTTSRTVSAGRPIRSGCRRLASTGAFTEKATTSATTCSIISPPTRIAPATSSGAAVRCWPAARCRTFLSQDVQNGNLPQVSWIVGPSWSTEHPEYMPAGGAYFLQQVLEALTSNTAVWQKTLLIVTYDENGGFFDHVRAPQAPRGTPGEYLTPAALATTPEAAGIAGPIGLGPRVPTMLISPFTRGGLVSSHTYDHTSVLRLLETRFGVEVPNLTHWRRATCGDLVEAINFAGTPRPRCPPSRTPPRSCGKPSRSAKPSRRPRFRSSRSCPGRSTASAAGPAARSSRKRRHQEN
ncbi:alkaline phosphatase family protein [Fodinicola feengrottensis]|uniref:alkaline phosphatase family protein n=1 Tax=Fodinicola feengrottensis TaxID=435914 RepID=UPI0024417C1F|nr:alkaline phosphatase family protein [Fodinicola feengrottensis]